MIKCKHERARASFASVPGARWAFICPAILDVTYEFIALSPGAGAFLQALVNESGGGVAPANSQGR